MNEFMYAIAGIFDTIVVIIYFGTVLGKRKGSWVLAAIFALQIITCIGSYLLNLSNNQGLTILWSVLILCGLAFLHKGTILGRIFHVVFIQVLAMLSEMACVFLGSIPFLANCIGKNEIDSVELVVSKLLFFLFVIIVLMIRKQCSSIPTKYLAYFTFVPLLSVLVVYGLANGQGIALSASLFSLLLLNIVVYYIMYLLADYSTNQAREEMLQEQIQMQRDNYDQLSQSFKRGNRLLHDVNKHLRQVGEYLAENEWEKATCYLGQIEGALQENYKVVNSGNIVLDSILSNLKNQVESFGGGVVLEMNVDVAQLKVDDYDLVTILGNVADNVMEAMKDVGEGEVYMSLETTENELLIFVKNPFVLNKKSKQRRDRWFHGLGLQNVKEAVEGYGGISSFEMNGEQFQTMIMIPYEWGDESES